MMSVRGSRCQDHSAPNPGATCKSRACLGACATHLASSPAWPPAAPGRPPAPTPLPGAPPAGTAAQPAGDQHVYEQHAGFDRHTSQARCSSAPSNLTCCSAAARSAACSCSTHCRSSSCFSCGDGTGPFGRCSVAGQACRRAAATSGGQCMLWQHPSPTHLEGPLLRCCQLQGPLLLSLSQLGSCLLLGCQQLGQQLLLPLCACRRQAVGGCLPLRLGLGVGRLQPLLPHPAIDGYRTR